MGWTMRELAAYASENWHLSIRFWEAANLNFAAAGALGALPIAVAVAGTWEFIWTNFGLRLLAAFSGTFLLLMLFIVTPFRMWRAQSRLVAEQEVQLHQLLAPRAALQILYDPNDPEFVRSDPNRNVNRYWVAVRNETNDRTIRDVVLVASPTKLLWATCVYEHSGRPCFAIWEKIAPGVTEWAELLVSTMRAGWTLSMKCSR